MGLVQRITEDIKTAMRARDEQRLAVVRALRNEVIKLSKSGTDKEVDDDDVVKIVKSQIKQRQDAIAMFEKGNRADLVETEQAQLVILQEYLPEQLTDAEIQEIVDKAIAESGATTKKEMGIVMKTAREIIAESGKDADNRKVSQIVGERLS